MNLVLLSDYINKKKNLVVIKQYIINKTKQNNA